MRLPNAENATITESKLAGYVLNEAHARNGGKARLFRALGYTRENWEVLASDIRDQHLSLDATEVDPNAFGRRYVIEANLRGPTGEARIRTSWFIAFGDETPYLTSAYRIRG